MPVTAKDRRPDESLHAFRTRRQRVHAIEAIEAAPDLETLKRLLTCWIASGSLTINAPGPFDRLER
jgi:hypothetical protein